MKDTPGAHKQGDRGQRKRESKRVLFYLLPFFLPEQVELMIVIAISGICVIFCVLFLCAKKPFMVGDVI